MAAPTNTAGPAGYTVGSLSANLINDGCLARQGDWIYYSGYPYAAFYKMKADGSQKTKISNSIGGFLNIIGDWIYFCSVKYGNPKPGPMKKMKLDGSGETIIGDVKSANYMNIVGDWIYYKNSEELTQLVPDGKICRMRLDGTANEQLSDDIARNTVVAGDWIYFEEGSPRSRIFKMKTDGTGKTEITGYFKMGFPSSYRTLTYFDVVDDYLYTFHDIGEGNAASGISSINRIRTDGTGEVRIVQDRTRAMAVADGWIYYANGNDGFKLYKIRTDGSKRTKLSNDRPYGISVLGDQLFMNVQGSANDNLIRIKADGTGRAEVK